MKPTWGVSFGLPQTGGVGPIAPHPGYPLGVSGYNPGYGGQGINLGPVSVNPLVAVQVTKDEYGEKIVKPYVNLHVTPNPGLIHKLGHLLAYKKHNLLGGHYAGGYGGYGVYAPHYHGYHEKPIYHYPSRPPYYSSHVHHHEHHTTHSKPHHHHGGYYPSGYYKDDNDDYDDYDYSDYASGDDYYYRNARGRNATPIKDNGQSTTERPTGEDRRQTSARITFTDRRKREATTFNETTEVRTAGRSVRSVRTGLIVVIGRRAAVRLIIRYRRMTENDHGDTDPAYLRTETVKLSGDRIVKIKFDGR